MGPTRWDARGLDRLHLFSCARPRDMGHSGRSSMSIAPDTHTCMDGKGLDQDQESGQGQDDVRSQTDSFLQLLSFVDSSIKPYDDFTQRFLSILSVGIPRPLPPVVGSV